MKRLRKLILIFTLYLLSFNLYATEENVGIIVASRGESYNQDNQALAQGMEVYHDDVIVTGDRSFVVIQFTDGSKLTVRPDSTIQINSYMFNGTSEDNMNLNLIQGGLRIVSGSIAKTSPENYTINTPVALMGVRGTEFAIYLCEDSVCTSD